ARGDPPGRADGTRGAGSPAAAPVGEEDSPRLLREGPRSGQAGEKAVSGDAARRLSFLPGRFMLVRLALGGCPGCPWPSGNPTNEATAAATPTLFYVTPAPPPVPASKRRSSPSIFFRLYCGV